MDWITLYDEPVRVRTPVPGLVYSTNPLTTEAANGRKYFLKGPAAEIVFAEAAGYTLAKLVGLAVPDCALCHLPGSSDVWFASAEIPVRSGVELLIDTDFQLNRTFLQGCIAFDVWIFNPDRNIGNVVGDSLEAGKLELFAIDFEKSAILRGISRFIITTMNPRDCWPNEPLDRICRRLPFPSEMCDLIAGVSQERIEGEFARLSMDINLANVPWADSAAGYLALRGSRIQDLIREVWRGQ